MELTMRILSSAILMLGLGAGAAQAADPALEYYGNSLLCKAQSSGAVCDLWLEPSGRYSVFYDSGQKAYVKGVEGDFENEGRTGTYTARATRAGLKLCLKPDADAPPRPPGHSPALFHEAGCVVLAQHPVGELWTLKLGGETYRMGLISGR
jgi:hypothetical protein